MVGGLMRLKLEELFGKSLEVPEVLWKSTCVVVTCPQRPVVIAHVTWKGDALDGMDIQYCEACWEARERITEDGKPVLKLLRRRQKHVSEED
jgi:hypothetical protein